MRSRRDSRRPPVLTGWLVMWSGLLAVSCSGSGGLNPVQGKVLFRDKPLHGVVLTFHPVGQTDVHTQRPIGLTKEDGTFTVTTGLKEGAPAGQYIVTFTYPEQPKTKAITMEMPETRDRFGGAYANPANSRIKVEIKSGLNQLEPFNLQ